MENPSKFSGATSEQLKRWVSLHSQFVAEWRSSNMVSEVDVILKLYGFNGNFDVDRLMPGAPACLLCVYMAFGQPSQKVNVGQQETNQKLDPKRFEPTHFQTTIQRVLEV